MTGVFRSLASLSRSTGSTSSRISVRTSRAREVLVGALVAAFASAALANPPRQPARGGRLVVGASSEAKHFNPLIAVDQPTKTVQSLLHGDLLHIDRATLEIFPNLASSWDVSDDGRVYTLTLREGLRFSDGHPVSVDDVSFSFEAYLDERVHSPQRDMLLVGGEPVRVESIDDRRVRFELAAPYAAGDRLFDSFYVLPRHLLEDVVEAGNAAGAWGLLTDPARMAGLGPFRVKDVVPGERIVLERNPHYWRIDPESGASLPYLDEVVFDLVSAEETELLRFQAGETHLIERVSPDGFERLEREGRFQMIDLGPGLEFHFLFFNLNESASDVLGPRRAWFGRPEFRRAIAAAIDENAIVDLVYRGRATVLTTHVSPGNHRWFHEDLAPEPYSETAARAVFESAGFRWDSDKRLIDATGDRVAFSLLTNAGNRERSMIASLVQEDLDRVGVEVRIVELEFRAYVDRIFQARDYDAALLALVSGDADPNTEMSFLLSDGSTHVWHLGRESPASPWEAEIDRLMREQVVTLDRKRRKALYDRVQEIVFEHRPIIGLVSPHVLVGADERLGNFRPGIVPPYTLWNADELFLERTSDQ